MPPRLSQSPTLAVDERIRSLQAAGEPVLHLAFGEAGLPVLPEVAAQLAAAAGRNSYGPTIGTTQLRSATAGYFSRRGLPTNPDQVIAGPGSKPLLYTLLAALPGDVVLPRPSWVTYAAQAMLAGKRVIGVPTPIHSGGVPDPDELDAAVRMTSWGDQRPGVLVLTLPDNPTGALPSPTLIKRVCEVADRHELVIISDEIYRDLAHDPAMLSPARLLPDRTVVTGGLSKATALGGWRLGFCRVPDTVDGRLLRDAVVSLASELWSSTAMPVQQAACYVLDEPSEVRDYVRAARQLHATVVGAAYRMLVTAGAHCRAPGGGFYLYPDLEPARGRLADQGVHTNVELAELLLERYRIGVLAGTAFGDDREALRFRMATSLLYGQDQDQRWQALHSADPVALPWISSALRRLAAAVADLTGAGPHRTQPVEAA